MKFRADKSHYIYTHSHKGDIFYIGKGQGGRCLEVNSRTDLWFSYVDEHQPYDVDIIQWFDDAESALVQEALLINEFRPVCNIVENPDVKLKINSINKKLSVNHSFRCLGLWKQMQATGQDICFEWSQFSSFRRWYIKNVRDRDAVYFSRVEGCDHSPDTVLVVSEKFHDILTLPPDVRQNSKTGKYYPNFRSLTIHPKQEFYDTKAEAEAAYYKVVGKIIIRHWKKLRNVESKVADEIYLMAHYMVNEGKLKTPVSLDKIKTA